MFSAGDLCGTMYNMSEAGDAVQKHAHGEKDNHITIVAKGRLKVVTDSGEAEYAAGSIIDFVVGEGHELIALDPNTRIFNIIKQAGGLAPYVPPALAELPNAVLV